MAKNDNYITLTEMANGFSEYNLPQTDLLTNKSVDVHLDDGNVLKYSFKTNRNLSFEVVGGPDDKFSGDAEYIATEIRKNLFYVSYPHSINCVISLILNMDKDMGTVIFSVFPTDETDTLPIFKRVMSGLPPYATDMHVHNASIGDPYLEGKTPKYEYTKELAGKNAVYQYSEKDAYIHTYYDVDLFTWYCFAGNEDGLGDTDYVRFLKLDENLYVILWIEKILQVASVIILDFDAHQSSGSMASYEGKDYHGKLLNVPSGAKITKIDGVNVPELKKAFTN